MFDDWETIEVPERDLKNQRGYRHDLKNLCGVYLIFDEEDLIYIGQTVCLRRRFREHGLSKKWFKSFRQGNFYCKFKPCEEPEKTIIEKSLIKKLKPRHNYIDTGLTRKQKIERVWGK